MAERDAGRCHLLDVPVEIWTYLALLAAEQDLPSAVSLVLACKALYSSDAGQAIRYLNALDKHGLPRPKRLPKRLDNETTALLSSTWPEQPHSHSEPVRSTLHARLGDLRLSDCGTVLASFNEDAATLFQWQTDDDASTSPSIIAFGSFGKDKIVSAWDIDVAEGVVAVLFADCDPPAIRNQDTGESSLPSHAFSNGTSLLGMNMQARSKGLLQISLSLVVLDRHTGQMKTKRPLQLSLPCTSRSLNVEICGGHVLLRACEDTRVYRWTRLRRSKLRKSLSFTDRIGDEEWELLWRRSVDERQPILSVHLLGLDVVMVLSQPRSSEHGTDWGSTIEMYRFSQAQPKVAEILLPIRAKSVRGMSFIRTGLGKQLKDRNSNSLIIISVEGFIWQAQLKPFLDLLFPQAALSPFGSTHLTLDIHWVRAHMFNSPLSPRDTRPMSVSVSGWRVAAAWSRALNSQLTGPPQQIGGAKAVFLRLINADPRRVDQRISGTGCREVQSGSPTDGHPLLVTTSVGDDFHTYCDHNLSRWLRPSEPLGIFVALGGSRMLLASKTQYVLLRT